MFERGLQCTEMVVKPLGGKLFGPQATPILTERAWGERAVAWLLDRLLWTPKKRGSETRERVHYGSLDVEDLGRVYEALLELEPGISAEPMCRLRRQKLEVVVPLAQGEKYRPIRPIDEEPAEDDDAENEDTDADDGEESNGRGKKTKVLWIEEIPPYRFYLRVGLGRKASGSYYTPHSFVRFLVQETLGPQVEKRSPQNDPKPLEILKLKVLDPAMGSGHFLVEACRFLGEKLYEACRSCDEKALEAERKAETANTNEKKTAALEAAKTWRQRIIELPDTDDELAKTEFVPRESKDQALEAVTGYLPSTSLSPGVSTARAQAICRRLVAVHCLYGVDKNPLAVELAKLALWLESHAEGMPLTFLDHRLVAGDSLTGPFWDNLLFRPGKPDTPVEDLFSLGIYSKLQKALTQALSFVRRLESSVGLDLADVLDKEALKAQVDRSLLPFRVAAAAWAGGVMLGPEKCDDLAYSRLLQAIGETERLPEIIDSAALRAQIARGLGLDAPPEDRTALEAAVGSLLTNPALPYDLAFPEVYYPNGLPHGRRGFDVVLGNPPWETLVISDRDFGSAYYPEFLESRGQRTKNLLKELFVSVYESKYIYININERTRSERIEKELLAYSHLPSPEQIGHADDFQLFGCRSYHFSRDGGLIGLVLPASFYSGEPASACRETLLIRSCPRVLVGVSNLKRYFEIAPVSKFCLICTHRGSTSTGATFRARFNVIDFAEVMVDAEWSGGVLYPVDIVAKATGQLRLVFESSNGVTMKLVNHLYQATSTTVGSFLDQQNIEIIQEFNTTTRDHLSNSIQDVVSNRKGSRFIFSQLEQGRSILAEAKTFYSYDWHYEGMPGSAWDPQPRKTVRIREFPVVVPRLPFFRLALRRTVGSVETNERSLVAAILPPGVTVADSAVVEKTPQARSNSVALWLLATLNCFIPDSVARLLVSANLNDYLLRSLPFASNLGSIRLLVHAALRLSSCDEAYSPLWREQVGDTWREVTKAAFTWPVLASEDERWLVRSAIDAVLAEAYDLSREQYAHVLSRFSHKSYPEAPELCLRMFDDLKIHGLDVFTKKHDPYWDMPLNENLPQPVIDLPVAEAEQATVGDPALGPQFRLSDQPSRQRAKRKR